MGAHLRCRRDGVDLVCDIEIGAEAGLIFPWLEEPERMRQWVQGLEHSEYLSPNEDLGVGIRFRQRMREMGRSVTYEGEVLEREPPQALVVALTHRRFHMRIGYRLGRKGTMTHLEYRLHLQPLDSTVARMERAMGWMLERGARQQLTRLKRCVEASAQAL
jgi:uncharacterized protein YndB with AHSA1/START domain